MRQLDLLSTQHSALSTRSAPKRILIIKLGGLGETLTITPALRALRETFPQTRIDALVSPIGAQALTGTGLVDDLIVGP